MFSSAQPCIHDPTHSFLYSQPFILKQQPLDTRLDYDGKQTFASTTSRFYNFTHFVTLNWNFTVAKTYFQQISGTTSQFRISLTILKNIHQHNLFYENIILPDTISRFHVFHAFWDI